MLKKEIKTVENKSKLCLIKKMINAKNLINNESFGNQVR